MGEYDGIIKFKYKVERAGEMPILEDIWTTPANLQIKGNCSFTNPVFCDVELILKRYILNQPFSFQIQWAFGTQRIADEQRSQALVDSPQPGAEQQHDHYDLIGTVQKTLPSCFSHLALSGVSDILDACFGSITIFLYTILEWSDELLGKMLGDWVSG